MVFCIIMILAGLIGLSVKIFFGSIRLAFRLAGVIIAAGIIISLLVPSISLFMFI